MLLHNHCYCSQIMGAWLLGTLISIFGGIFLIGSGVPSFGIAGLVLIILWCFGPAWIPIWVYHHHPDWTESPLGD